MIKLWRDVEPSDQCLRPQKTLVGNTIIREKRIVQKVRGRIMVHDPLSLLHQISMYYFIISCHGKHEKATGNENKIKRGFGQLSKKVVISP